MYTTEDPKYKEPYYGLIQVTDTIWKSIRERKRESNKNLIFGKRVINKSTWRNVETRLELLKRFTSLGKVFVAGGAIYSFMHGLPVKDIDLFLYDCTPEEALDKLKSIIAIAKKNNNFETDIIRTKNAITITCVEIPFETKHQKRRW